MKIISLNAEQKILILICLIITVSRFSLDCYLPSLPAISDYFQVDPSQTQLTLTTFLIGFSGSQFFYGPLSDSFGRRKIILIGFCIFIAGLFLCFISTSIFMLLCSRFITGLGAGVSSSLKRAVASDLFMDHRLAKASAMQSNATVLTILIAPVIGGYVQHHFGWRINFLVVLIYACIVFILVFRTLPDTHNNRYKTSFTPKLLFLNYMTVMFYPPFYKNVLYSTCAFTGMVIFTQLSAFLFMNLLAIDAVHYGWIMMLIFLSYLAAGSLVNCCVEKIGMFRLLAIGIIIMLMSGLILFLLSLKQPISILHILLPTLFFVMGARIVIPNAMARSLSPLPHLSGYASSLIGIIQTTGAALGSYLIAQLEHPNVSLLAGAYLFLSGLPLIVLTLFDVDILPGLKTENSG